MNKYPLIGASIIAMVLLVLGSLSNVVGYQTVQSSNQKEIKDEVSQKELLFQTIVDIANNKEIQRIILNSQISREGFFNPDMKSSIFNPPVLTKNQLKHMYLIDVMLSKIISKSRMHTIIEQHQLTNQGLQKKIISVIEKDTTLNGEISQISKLNCDCENISAVTVWQFPIICPILATICFFVFFIASYLHILINILLLLEILLEMFNCPGTP